FPDQDGIDRAVRFDQACRLPGADAEHDPAAAPPDGLRGLNEAHLAVGGVEDEVDAPAIGQLRDFGGDVVAGLRTATRTPNRFPLVRRRRLPLARVRPTWVP